MLKKIQSVRRKSSPRLFLIITIILVVIFFSYIFYSGKLFHSKSIDESLQEKLSYLKNDPAYISMRIDARNSLIEIVVELEKITNLDAFVRGVLQRIQKVATGFQLKIISSKDKTTLKEQTIY